MKNLNESTIPKIFVDETNNSERSEQTQLIEQFHEMQKVVAAKIDFYSSQVSLKKIREVTLDSKFSV